jgi:oligoendopeptidase F
MSIPERDQIKKEDQWDLSSLYPSPEEWEKDFQRLEILGPKIADFKGTLGNTPRALAKALDFLMEVEQLEERLGYYAQLRIAENVGNSESNGRFGRLMSVSTKVAALGAYFTPEIQSIPEEEMSKFLQDPILEGYRIYLNKILRSKPHVLSEEGEKIIALSGESRTAIRKTFSNLTNVDLKFGEIAVGAETKPLSQSTFSTFLQNPEHKIRKAACEQFYGEFKDHEHTLGSLLAGSVQDDVYIARVRGHKSARAKSLFPDKVPESVYDNLISVIHEHLPLLHDYYDFRQKALGLEKLHHCDVYAPLTVKLDSTIPFSEAVDLTTAALHPLGEEYTRTMAAGLKGGWVDRYENKGKRSGAFSAGSYAKATPIFSSTTKPTISGTSSPWLTRPATPCTPGIP